MRRELLVQGPDGQVSTIPLLGTRVAVGRASTVELSYPEDAGLSRQHFVFEPLGEEWTVQDLGSKNGTYVNNIPLKARLTLHPGDRITAGHLTITYCPESKAPPSKRRGAPEVVVFASEDTKSTAPPVLTSLEGATLMLQRGGGAKTSVIVEALKNAGLALSENRPLAEWFDVILDLAIKAVAAQRGVLIVPEGDTLVAKANKGEGFRISTKVCDQVLHEKASVLVRNTQTDETFRGRMSIMEQQVHTMMAVPLQAKERILGLIYVDSPSVFREFTQEDLSLLTVMANVAAARLEAARLAEMEQAERLLKRELSEAADIQQRILPEAPPQVAGLDLAGFNTPCRTVGGDYYGYLSYPDGRVGLALGDVSGKGMPAALMVFAFEARLRVIAAEVPGAAELVTRLNKITCANCPSNRFITFFYGVLDPVKGELEFSNAGHNPPIVIRDSGGAELLEGGGPVLGILSIARYDAQRIRFGPGDTLVVYSDGVTEAMNPAEEEYGEERLIQVLKQHRNDSADSMVSAVRESLQRFTSGAPQADDITVLVAKHL